jgi:spermidine synthase
MANSGKVDASTRGDMKTQTLSAHFPMLFHPGAKTVMVVGLASGITAGEVLYYPVERLDVVEINKQVIAASDYFIPWNNDVLKDPRTNLIVQDGRAHLGLTDQDYDVIISEPSNPWLAGLAALFTEDFFTLARARLNDGGIFVQFIHSYQMDWATFAMVGRTLARVFPNSLLVTTAPSGLGPDYLLVGFNGPGRYLLDVAEENLPYARASTNITLSDVRLIYPMILSENLPVLFGDGPVHTDVRPRLEFRAPKLLYHNDDVIQRTIEARRQLSEETQAIRSQLESDVDLQIDYTAYALSVHSLFGGMVDLGKATALQRERFFNVTDSYFASHSVDFNLVLNDSLIQHWRSVQIDAIEGSVDSLSDRALSYSYLGSLYNEDDRLAEAIASYRKSLQYESEVAAVHCNLGVVMTKLDSLDEAVVYFKEAIKIDPAFPDAHSGLGLVLARKGRVDEAIGHFRRAVQINPDDVTAQHNLGLALAQQGKLDEAIVFFSSAIALQPQFADGHCNLAVALTQKGRLDEAERHFMEALRIRPDFEAARTGLERARFLKQVRDR